jgi:NAD(P)-dependent dehydrogenase (short-subunit alcohol dehydrogenase family)
MNSDALRGKVLVIIGGTTGLGLSASRACIAAGAKVVAVGLGTPDPSGPSLADTLRLISADATDPATAPKAIADAINNFGRFDGLYHVAGGSGRAKGDGPLHELSDEGWAYTFQLNLTSVFYSNRAAAKQFLEQDSTGSVLNMGSVLGFSPSPRYFTTHAYATAKAAIIGLTTASAAYYAPRGIRFNVIAPALVDTRMATRASEDEAIMRFISTKQPLDGGRIGQPEDLDAAVVYFLSDQSKFVTGQVLAVDGGWSVAEGQYARGSESSG